MGFFHKRLKDISKSIESEDFAGALAILSQHISSEEKFMKELAGLQAAISTYQQRLKEVKSLLGSWKAIERGGELAGRLRGTGYLQEELTKREYIKQLNKKLDEARDNYKEIEALLSSLWRKERKELK